MMERDRSETRLLTRAVATMNHKLLVNVVLATDIVDQELKQLRNNRWDKAFKCGDSGKPTALISREEVNRKATIVLEHIIQASDISHTMQHWHVYRKWVRLVRLHRVTRR
jgi:3'5'-cyclic nucleotide phosphodiesterase